MTLPTTLFAAEAVRVWPNMTNEPYHAYVGEGVPHVSVETRDASLQPVPNTPITVQALGCGSFGGLTSFTLTTDAYGHADIWNWRSPAWEAICTIVVDLVNNRSAMSAMTTQVVVTHPADYFPPIYTTWSVPVYGTPRSNVTLKGIAGESLLGARTVSFDDVSASLHLDADPFHPDKYYEVKAGGWTITFSSGAFMGWSAEWAGTWGYNERGAARMLISPPSGTGCTFVTGRFGIFELEIQAGQLTRLAAELEQHCDGQEAPLTATIRFNSQIVDFWGPWGTFEYVDDRRTFSVLEGTTFDGPLQIVVKGLDGKPVSNYWMLVYAGCGVLEGRPRQLWSDANGVVTLPRWKAPAAGATCDLVLRSHHDYRPDAVFTMHSIATPLQPPPAAPVTTRVAGSPDSGISSISIDAPTPTCTLASASFLDRTVTPLPAPVPAGIGSSNAYLDFRVENCGTGQSVTFTVETGRLLPPTAQWWKFGPTPEDRVPHWYSIASRVDGSKISFTITDGGLGDDDLVQNGSIADLGMIATVGGPMQDLWWSGSSENGWGMSIVQHRDVLFANLFIYDASGNPTWYVMPSGSWNENHTAYTGALYLPKGSPFNAYDASKFDIGAAKGTATLTFANVNEATLDYTISGVSGRKSISRLAFGPRDAPTDKPLGDLWWGGTQQNGWGVAILQQYSSLFALWFTYDANGKATWFVMPSGTWAAKNDFRGSIFKATGAPWLGGTYDASRHRTTEAGNFRLRFDGDAAQFEHTLEGASGSIPLSRIPF